ncbi:hypothetical protein ACQPXM_01700 [Kribbella sp. CA-253562]|uniref:hypothetical protein n=1 Tax=Kribbella sp. CA-253562 TaxID=3239942 RepID=UPI003D8CB66A
MRHASLGLTAVVLCATAVLTGCGPRPAAAKVGMTVDDAGRPVIVLQDCKEGDMVELQIFDESRTGPRSPGDRELPIAVYTAREGSKSVQQLPVATGSADWEPVTVVPELRPGTAYRVRSWGEGHESFGGLTVFTPNDLKALKPGEVRYAVPRMSTPGVSPNYQDEYRVSSLDEFTPSQCD